MIEDDDIAIQAEVQVGNATVVFGRALEGKLLGLEVAHAIEAGETDETTSECRRKPQRRQRVRRCRTIGRGQFTKQRKRVATLNALAGLATMIDDRGCKAARGQLDARPRGEDRMTADIHSILHRLEQKARCGALVGQHQLSIRQHRRKLVAHQPAREDDERPLGALTVERFLQFLHGWQGSRSPPAATIAASWMP